MNRIAVDFAAYIVDLVERGGPSVSEYSDFTRWIQDFDCAFRGGNVTEADRLWVLKAFGPAMSLDTVQGMVVQQQYGYPGDFEVIDRIYTTWMSSRPNLVNWDRYGHAQAAPKAVRNRKAYLHRLLSRLQDGASVLNLGSGPGRCLLEWLDSNPRAAIRIDCVDFDRRAIEYASRLNGQHSDRLVFHQANILRYRPAQKYDLVWAAGLFDYFNDRVFAAVARRFLAAVAPGGELVIGNFAVGNPTKAHMELCGWRLNHRSPVQLIALASSWADGCTSVRVDAEPEGVNLFLHVTP